MGGSVIQDPGPVVIDAPVGASQAKNDSIERYQRGIDSLRSRLALIRRTERAAGIIREIVAGCRQRYALAHEVDELAAALGPIAARAHADRAGIVKELERLERLKELAVTAATIVERGRAAEQISLVFERWQAASALDSSEGADTVDDVPVDGATLPTDLRTIWERARHHHLAMRRLHDLESVVDDLDDLVVAVEEERLIVAGPLPTDQVALVERLTRIDAALRTLGEADRLDALVTERHAAAASAEAVAGLLTERAQVLAEIRVDEERARSLAAELPVAQPAGHDERLSAMVKAAIARIEARINVKRRRSIALEVEIGLRGEEIGANSVALTCIAGRARREAQQAKETALQLRDSLSEHGIPADPTVLAHERDRLIGALAEVRTLESQQRRIERQALIANRHRHALARSIDQLQRETGASEEQHARDQADLLTEIDTAQVAADAAWRAIRVQSLRPVAQLTPVDLTGPIIGIGEEQQRLASRLSAIDARLVGQRQAVLAEAIGLDLPTDWDETAWCALGDSAETLLSTLDLEGTTRALGNLDRLVRTATLVQIGNDLATSSRESALLVRQVSSGPLAS